MSGRGKAVNDGRDIALPVSLRELIMKKKHNAILKSQIEGYEKMLNSVQEDEAAEGEENEDEEEEEQVN